MLFNSIEYMLFLPIVFMIYWLLYRNVKAQNIFILCASYLFYGLWDWRFLILIAFTTLCSFVSGILISGSENHVGRKLVSVANIMVNLAILGVFKYYDFFAGSFSRLLGVMGIDTGYVTLNIVLPVGISFYTFQALSYSIDVYRKRLNATTNIVAFAAYISFFPQLVAGPIERATQLLPQFYVKRRFDYSKAVDGLRQILWGFFKKVAIADSCASVVDRVFNDYILYDSSNLILAAILFSIQIYCDFSGYSDIAIGTAKLFGIDLICNFRYPYFSRDIAEFWRRWHISLNTWFRDYVYIPLGGSRCGRTKVFRNILVIFLLSGLWHGANWTFVAWGAYHAVLFLPLILLGLNRRNVGEIQHGSMSWNLMVAIQIIITFILVTVGWIIFRADNIDNAWGYIVKIFTSGEFGPIISCKTIMCYVFIMLVCEWINRGHEHALNLRGVKCKWLRYMIYYALIFLIWVNTSSSGQFIYFQF